MSRNAAPLLLGHTARSRRGDLVAAVVLALLAFALAPGVVAIVGPAVETWRPYLLLPTLFATTYAYRDDGLGVCWLLAGLPTFAAVIQLQVGGWFGPPSPSQLVYAGVLFGGAVALLAGTAGFILGVGLRILRGELGV